MISLKTTFGRAASGNSGITFWLLFFAIAILDDAQRGEEERRKKRDRDAKRPCKPNRPAGPRPL